jgi:FkbM family methyltransferase
MSKWTSRAARLIALPMKIVPPRLRSEIVDRLASDTFSVTDIPGGRIRFYTPSPLLMARANSVLSKETDTISWIDSFEPGTVFWDVGANVGIYTLYAAVQKRVSVLAFEPSAANFHVLSRNLESNGIGDWGTAYCIAFSGRTELGVMNLASSAMGAAISQFGCLGEMSRYWEGLPGATSQGMIGFSIDDFIKQFNPPFPNYLKLDVDGLESSILEGAYFTLRDARLRSVIVELDIGSEGDYRKAQSLLESAGFRFISRGEVQAEHAANHLFERIPAPATAEGIAATQEVCTAESADPAR